MADQDTKPKGFTLSKEVIAEALEGEEVVSYLVERAVAEGEHYLSSLQRITVNLKRAKGEEETETKTVIIKTYPEGVMLDFTRDSSCLTKEIVCYRDVLPLMEKHLAGRNPSPLRLTSGADYLVMEDLKPQGYRMSDRIQRLDFNHCVASLKALADFHAASYKAERESSETFSKVKKETIYVEENFYMKSFVINNFKLMGDLYKEDPQLKDYAELLRESGERSWNRILKEIVPREDEFNVFNHGDFWTNNILFKYDSEGAVQDVKLVDYQFCRWSTPAVDIQMFLTTSVRNKQDIPALVEVYLNQLHKHLPGVLTRQKLDADIKRLDVFGLIAVVCLLPICVLDSSTPLDFRGVDKEDFDKNFQEIDNPYLRACNDRRFKQILPDYLGYYKDVGLLSL